MDNQNIRGSILLMGLDSSIPYPEWLAGPLILPYTVFLLEVKRAGCDINHSQLSSAGNYQIMQIYLHMKAKLHIGYSAKVYHFPTPECISLLYRSRFQQKNEEFIQF
jgi:hypothetical protein